MLVTPDAGELILLQYAVKEESITTGYKLKLYKNDFTPSQNSFSISDFTEADFVDYDEFLIARSEWDDATTDACHRASIQATDSYTWVSGSTQTVHGYYIVLDDYAEADDNTVLWAERFAAPQALEDGDHLTVRPKITGQSADEVDDCHA